MQNCFWCWSFLVLNEEPSRCRSILTSPIGLNFIAWNGANRGGAKYYHTSHPRWSWHWRAALFLTFHDVVLAEEISQLLYCSQNEIFWNGDIFWLKSLYLFLPKETGLLEWKYFWLLSWPLFYSCMPSMTSHLILFLRILESSKRLWIDLCYYFECN